MSDEIQGLATPTDQLDDYNALQFIIDVMIKNTVNTVDVVKVVAVDSEKHEVDVIPVVKPLLASGQPLDESEIYGLKYIQYQAGGNAVLMTPEVGDIGLILINKKDIKNIAGGIAGSYRNFSPADGVYLGGIFGFNKQPTQKVEFKTDGLHIDSAVKVFLNAPDVDVQATNVNVNSSGSATITSPSIDLGGAGGLGVARIGDSVNLTTGKIVSGSATVKAIA
jgi:hypothetical protein